MIEKMMRNNDNGMMAEDGSRYDDIDELLLII